MQMTSYTFILNSIENFLKVQPVYRTELELLKYHGNMIFKFEAFDIK